MLLPANLEVGSEVLRNITAGLFHLVYDVRLVHHVPLPVRDQFFEMIGQQLPAYVNPGRT
jgi:hypothetical protein